MALVKIPGGIVFPDPAYFTTALNTSTFVIDASGEVAVCVFQAPKAGNLAGFEGLVAAMSNVPDNGLRFSFQNPNATGFQDGVVDQFATIASGSLATGWMNPGNFNSVRAVTLGEFVCAVIDIPTFTAGDNITIAGYASAMMTVAGGFPYGIGATATKQSLGMMPVIALRYDDGTYAMIPYTAPYVTVANSSIDTGTTPDEIALAFTVHAPMTISEIIWMGVVPVAGDYFALIYDSGGATAGGGFSDGDVVSAAAARVHRIILTTPVDVDAGSTYYATITPNTTNNLQIYYATLPGLAYYDALPGGQTYYMAQRTNAGAWTHFNNGTDGYRRPMIGFVASHIDDGAGSGGGGITRAALPSGLSALG